MNLEGNCELVALIHDLLHDEIKVEASIGAEATQVIINVKELEAYEGNDALARLFDTDDLEKIEAFRKQCLYGGW
ncbi:hypothetical protein [Halomonas dongshanensis]|uniref:Uncharacterized protein n=1 Tax=Halomonas dongshanensis TaxID=2890835 RepID=A0ABT2ECT3_9GAMM|nr:hypothetical protein [Halomonas dongshanensis]MCS2609383.1 hypothetical protein [Halomonas dongshanensis]